jgi:hypothetical protein
VGGFGFFEQPTAKITPRAVTPMIVKGDMRIKCERLFEVEHDHLPCCQFCFLRGAQKTNGDKAENSVGDDQY